MMLRLMEGLVFKPHRVVILLLLIQNRAALSQLTVPSQPVVATVSDDVLLPCQLTPTRDASDMAVEWSRQDLNPPLVYLVREKVELVSGKNPAYEGKTSMSMDKLKLGDLSLELSKVKLSDAGTYKCHVPTLGVGSTVQLVVGTASSIGLRLVKTEDEERVALQCESRGWYPEPEALWLDAEGNLLSAGPPETVRGPDDLYTVSRRLTVDKRHNNSFTCRVQQNNTHQTRETHINVPGDVFIPGNSPVGHITISLIVIFIVILGVVFLVVKGCRRHRSKNVTSGKKSSTTGTSQKPEECSLVVEEQREMVQVKEESLTIMDLDEEERELIKELKDLDDQTTHVVALVQLLMDTRKEKEKEINDMEKKRDEIQNKMKRKADEKKKSKRETKMKHLEKELEHKQKVLPSVLYGADVMMEKKKVLGDRMEEIKKQLKEIKKDRNKVQTKNNSDQPPV